MSRHQLFAAVFNLQSKIFLSAYPFEPFEITCFLSRKGQVKFNYVVWGINVFSDMRIKSPPAEKMNLPTTCIPRLSAMESTVAQAHIIKYLRDINYAPDEHLQFLLWEFLDTHGPRAYKKFTDMTSQPALADLARTIMQEFNPYDELQRQQYNAKRSV
jgi:hypothetical protein